MNIDHLEYEFSYESEGPSFIFEEIIARYYFAWSAIIFSKDSVVQVYVPKLEVTRVKNSSLAISEESFNQSRLEIAKITNELKEGIGKYKDRIIKSDFDGVFRTIKKIVELYVIFDAYYGDGIYESNHNDPRVALICDLKNKIRDDLDYVFFKKDGWFETVLDALAKQFNVKEDDIRWYSEGELKKLFIGEKIDDISIGERRRAYLFLRRGNGEIEFFEGEEALSIGKDFSKGPDKKILQGKVANGAGQVFSGKVTLLKRDYSNRKKLSEDMEKMEEGTILVSQTTDPELMPAIKKARAIITDIGGMLSHSAISARELNIPCIVGTENASEILKTGDMIEVDANKGTVRKIS